MDGSLQRALGRNLRAIRQELGLSQERMAERLDLHRTYIGGLERGERNLTLDTVERLGGRLGLHPLDLLWDREGVAVVLDPGGVPHLSERAEGRATQVSAAAQGRAGRAPAAESRRHRPRV